MSQPCIIKLSFPLTENVMSKRTTVLREILMKLTASQTSFPDFEIRLYFIYQSCRYTKNKKSLFHFEKHILSLKTPFVNF